MQLSTELPFALEEGDYELAVQIFSDGTRSESVSTKTKIRLTNGDINFLKENQLGPANTSRRILVFFFQRGDDANYFVRAKKS